VIGMTYLDLLQVYNIKNGKNLNNISAIFDGIDIDSRINIEVLATTILDECGAMRCIYDTTPAFKIFSDNFFKKYKDNITKILDALEVNYGPLESINFNWTETTNISQNLDTDENSTEDRTKSNTGTQDKSNTGTSTRNNTGTKETTNTGTVSDSGNGSEENKVSAMNDSNYQPDSNRTTSNTNTRTDNTSELETDNLSEQRRDDLLETITDDKREVIDANNTRTKNEQLTWGETDTHSERGSKGFAYQDLIQKEIKLRNFSIYEWISKKYAKELFLLVY
jgi:hypothetical protein